MSGKLLFDKLVQLARRCGIRLWSWILDRRAPAAACGVAAGRWLCGTRAGRRTAGIGLLLLAAAFWIGGCGGQRERPAKSLAAPPSLDAVPTATAAGGSPPLVVTVLRVPAGDGDPLEAVFAAQEAVGLQTGAYVERLLARLNAEDAAYIRSMQRVYTTGQLLCELQRWTTEADNADLVDAAARAELTRLLDRWSHCEREIAGLMLKGAKP